MKSILFYTLLFVSLSVSAQYSDAPECVARKAIVGDVVSGVNLNLVTQQTFRYATPRRNADGIFQELFVVGLKNKTAPRNGKSIIYIHGGGFRGGSAWSDNIGDVYDCLMIDRGYDIWLVEYRTGWVPCDALTPGDADFCDPALNEDIFIRAVNKAVGDSKAGLRFIAKNWAALGYGEPFILWGTSAGGSTVQQLVFQDDNSDFTIDTLGIDYAYIGFGGDGLAEVPTYQWNRIPVLISHNNDDNIAPWSNTAPTNGGNIYTNVDLPENYGGLDLFGGIVANSDLTPEASVYFWAVCNQGHGLGQAAAFGPTDQYDNLFCGPYGMFDYFIPAVEAGTWGGARRITWANGSSGTPTSAPSYPGDLCPCETLGNCDPPDNCP